MNTHYIKAFWVGLMDGDGSIQVNHWRQKCLQFRLVIKLKFTPANQQMLQLIANTIGGSVKCVKHSLKKKSSHTKQLFLNNAEFAFVLWVENHFDRIKHLILILEEYPPLTSRLQCQYEFLRQYITHRYGVHQYLQERHDKYKHQKLKIQQVFDFSQKTYFAAWLSGFIEAEGCFCQRQNGFHSFSISQKYETSLILAIQQYFTQQKIVPQSKSLKTKCVQKALPFCKKKNQSSCVGTPTKPGAVFEAKNFVQNLEAKKRGDLAIWETYDKTYLWRIIEHCTTYAPLLGEKRVSLERFINVLKSK